MYTSNISILPFTILEATILVVIRINVLFYNISYSNINNIPCFMNYNKYHRIAIYIEESGGGYRVFYHCVWDSGIWGDKRLLTASTLAAGQHSVIIQATNNDSIIHFFKCSSICRTHFCQYISCDFHYYNCSVGKSGVYPPQWPPYRLLCVVWGTRGAEYTDYEYIRRKCHYIQLQSPIWFP